MAVQLIKDGKAFVCDQTMEEVREYRGGWNKPGRNSPYRDRPVEENLDLFERMKKGEFKNGEKTLRAKIDMSSSNMNLRDPAMYRIRHVPHHRTGDKWCIYPTYDWTHGQSDSIEGITHSICTLEFEIHRPLYDWYIEALGIHHPQQIEFAKLKIGPYDDQQTKTQGTCRRQLCIGLGRSPHADTFRDSPSRRDARSDSGFLRAGGRDQNEQSDGSGVVQPLCPRTSQQDSPRRMVSPGSAESGDRKLSGRKIGNACGDQ